MKTKVLADECGRLEVRNGAQDCHGCGAVRGSDL